ncbi:hypothetical protein BDQ17DRAFT_1349165 [Cyathus striatus]|nr:hypothetical protein BDQ17DRAFT_1349165 [Cyathus striatus]
MSDQDHDWSAYLTDHPIFSLPPSFSGPAALPKSNLELSTISLHSFTSLDPAHDGPLPQEDARQIRITSLTDARLHNTSPKTYKTLHTPNIQFEIHQIALNPTGKLLAVAGAFQVAVVVLPRTGFTRLVSETIDSKSLQVGQFYHSAANSAPIAKVDWHPWGEAGSTLLVMTIDGKLREYDISVDSEEPQQVLSFVSERKSKSFVAEDPAEREAASFVLGKGRADWGPLTMYAVMRSGDIYSICPYVPQNASIPSSYIRSLECFIAAKQEFLAQGSSSSSFSTKNLSLIYDYQQKYVSSLVKQLPPNTIFPSPSRSVLIHPPTSIKPLPSRQGPFLLQPSPRLLEGSEGGDATDITYLAFGRDDEEEGGGPDTEHLGVVMVSYQDGKVDVFLDVEKVEARWDVKNVPNRDLPMLAVYETIDLGLVSTLSRISSTPNQPPVLNLLRANHPVFSLDPIHDDTLYLYHAFGVHTLCIRSLLQTLAVALKADEEEELKSAVEQSSGTIVRAILTTFSVERRCSNPIIAVATPNDVYLTYSIFILTSAMRINVFPLNIRSESPPLKPKALLELPSNSDTEKDEWLIPVDGPSTYVSLLGSQPYKPPPVVSASGFPSTAKLSLPPGSGSNEFMLTPDTLRYITTTISKISGQIHEIQLAYRAVEARADLQKQELVRDGEHLTNEKANASVDRLKAIQDQQKQLLSRLDRVLQGLMEKASPELSEHETKWFEELKRMKAEVVGSGRYDEGSLVARTRLLQREYERLMPSLKALVEKEKSQKNKTMENNKSLGLSQAFELGERSNFERTRISNVEKDISRLASRLDVTLGRPPSTS